MSKIKYSDYATIICIMIWGIVFVVMGLLTVLSACHPGVFEGCLTSDIVNVTVSYSKVVSDWNNKCTTRYKGLLPCYDVYVYLANDDGSGKDCTFHQKFDNEDFPYVNATLWIYEVGKSMTMIRESSDKCSFIERSITDEIARLSFGVVLIIAGILCVVCSGIYGLNRIFMKSDLRRG